MNILIVANGMDIGGAETHITELCRVLVLMSHEVTVLSPYGVYTECLRACGVRCIALPAYQKTVASFFSVCRTVSYVCKQIKPDVVHSHARPMALACALVCHMLGLPHVTTAHLPFDRKSLREYMTVWGDATLSVSADITRHLLRVYGVDRQQIFETVNGIDTSRFRAKGGCAPYLTHVSRLDRDRAKTAELLLSCAEAIFDSGVCDRIVIVGDGSERARLTRRAEQINKKLGKPFVFMAGKQSDILPFLRDRPVFVGVSRAALEAMACECSVILSGNEGYIGCVRKDTLSLQYKENFCARSGEKASAASLLRDVRRAFALSSDERMRLGRSMRTFVLQHYGTEKMACDALRAYRFAIHRQSRGHTTILCGYFGQGNAGDEIVLRSLADRYRKNGVYSIAVIGGKNSRLRVEDCYVKRIGKYNLPSFLRHIKQGDCFALAGGNLLQNQTGNLSLAYYLALSYLARVKGARVQILRGGIGDLDGKLAKRACAHIVQGCDTVTMRTPKDIRAAMTLTEGRSPIRHECDASLLSPLCRFEKPTKRARVHVAVALRVPRTHQEKKETVVLLRRLTASSGKTPRFLPFHQGEDEEYARMLREKVGVGDITRWRNATDIARIMRESDFCITSRLHAVYAALLCGIPCYALDYDRKMRAHINYMMQCARAVGCPSPVMLISADSLYLKSLPKLGRGDYARLCAAMVTGEGL